NRLGDYSYGTYIFAHPIQMGLFTLGVAASWWANMILTIAIVLPLAALSWHLLEKRALRIPLPARGRPGDKVSRNYAGRLRRVATSVYRLSKRRAAMLGSYCVSTLLYPRKPMSIASAGFSRRATIRLAIAPASLGLTR